MLFRLFKTLQARLCKKLRKHNHLGQNGERPFCKHYENLGKTMEEYVVYYVFIFYRYSTMERARKRAGLFVAGFFIMSYVLSFVFIIKMCKAEAELRRKHAECV